MPYILLDTETTGLDPATSDVIELGACVLDESLALVGPEFECTIRPVKPVNPQAIAINGHDWALNCASEGWMSALDRADAWKSFTAWIREHYGPKGWIVMVGWNVSFDHAHLRALCDSVCGWWPFHFQVLDLLQICRYMDVRAGRSRFSYRLDRLAQELGGVPKDGKLHTALTDARTALAVLERFEAGCCVLVV